MELTNFGTALEFAIDLEAAGQHTFESRADSATQGELKDLFLSFSNTNKKRKEMLENLYKESVYSDQDTGIFEPIAGLSRLEDPIHQDPGADDQCCGSLIHAIAMEERSRKFYLELAAELKSRRRGLSKQFEDMAKENTKRKQELMLLQNEDSLG